VVFGRSLTLRHPGKIALGDNVVIDDYAVLDAKGNRENRMEIGNNVIIGRSSVISCKNGDLFIGDNTNIAMNCFIQSGKLVTIGKNVLFAAYCYVIGGGDHETDRTDIPIIAQGQVVRGITIEDNCWIGAGVKVQDGTLVGRDSIIGSGAVVTKDIPPFSIAVGVPAKVVKERK
jgi:acetyltransferase-like isoleucine patch superfamily enzyme